MNRAHKIRLYPNDKQATYLAKACGVARFAYNWALSEWKIAIETGEPISESVLRKRLNAVKPEKYPWMLEVTKCAPQLAIRKDLNNAFKNYYAKRAEFPKYRKKGADESFSLNNDSFLVQGKAIRIPKLGWVRMAEELRFDGKIIEATISQTANKWYVAIQVEMDTPPLATIDTIHAVGVDLGINALATLSDGTTIQGVRVSKSCEKKLRRLNKEMSRRQGGKKGEEKSKNYIKSKEKINRLYAKMANVRSDQTHKLTSELTQNYDLIGIEDLDVSEMMESHELAQSIADMSFYEFRRQLEYKAETANTHIVIADRWFASSKICNACGHKYNGLSLNTRKWTCQNCGTRHDRDINAAINLKNYAANHLQ